MNASLRRIVVAGAGLALFVPGALAAGPSRFEVAPLQRSTMGVVPSSGATLLVTFSDVPAADVVAERLAGLGLVRASVPEAGIWELKPDDVATGRSAAAARSGVVRAEWSLVRRLSAFSPKRRPAIAALPEIAVTTPTDDKYADAVNGQWSMHTGRWRPSLTGQPGRPIIALLDSGLDRTQQEWLGSDLVVSEYSTIKRTASAPDVSTSGHGTHVAGIAAGPIDNQGIVGVAPADPSKPTARVMPVQIANSAGLSSDATIMSGIVWAVEHHAKVINISSGGPGYSQAFQDTVNWAFRRGAIIVASVGNEGLDFNPLNFPAGYDHVVGVGAQCDDVVDRPNCPVANGVAAFSNRNFSVDLVAPGVNILSTLSKNVFSPETGYGRLEGTSMAAPYVAGTAALIYGSHPGIRPHQVIQLLEQTATRAAAGRYRTSNAGWGNVNPIAAVNATAPRDDLAEPNDDVNFVPKTRDVFLPLSRPRVVFSAWADYYDDPMDVYSLRLRRGTRVRVVVTARTTALRAYAFTGTGRISPRIMSNAAFARRFEGGTRLATPTSRSFIFRARTTGRHFIQLLALRGGGDYKLKFERLR